MNESNLSLDDIGLLYGTDKASNQHNFLNFYEEQFKAARFAPKTILEIGVLDGNSLIMWRDYFPDATVWGIDINPVPSIVGVKTIQGDATQNGVMGHFFGNNIRFDLIVDDGSHMTKDQQTVLHNFWPLLAPGGIFIIEDLHTSFLDGYINTNQTTYDYLTTNEYLKDHVKIYQRMPDKLTDSVTAMIFK